jgi:hypothetical protein
MTALQNTTSLIPVSSTSFLPAEFQEMEEYMGSAHSKSTDRSYGDAWAEFTDWAQPKGYPTLPAQPMVIGKFLTYLADRRHNKAATLAIKLAAIPTSTARPGRLTRPRMLSFKR